MRSRHAVGAEPVADVAEFVAFGVESSDDERRPSDALREGYGQEPRRLWSARCGGRARARLIGRTQTPAVRKMIGAIDRGLGAVVRLAAAGHAENLGPGRRRRSGGRGGRGGVGLVMTMPPDAEEPLLQVAIGGERARVHDAVDAAVHHDRDMIGNGGRNADVLLDDEDRDILFVREANEKIANLCDDHRGKPLGRLVHDEKARIAEKRPSDRQHLLLAARKLAAAVAAPLGKARKGRIDALDRPGALDARAETQRLVDRKARPKAASLGHEADAGAGDLMRLDADKLAALEADRA